VLGDAGLGTFGRVLSCWDTEKGMKVAVKVIRRIAKYTDSAKIEADILRDVNRRSGGEGGNRESLCVNLLDTFKHDGHMCLSFDALGCSLYDWLKRHKYVPFPVDYVASFARQLIHAIGFMHTMRLTHTDLKPENILLVDSDATTRVRVVLPLPTGSTEPTPAAATAAAGGAAGATGEEQAVEMSRRAREREKALEAALEEQAARELDKLRAQEAGAGAPASTTPPLGGGGACGADAGAAPGAAPGAASASAASRPGLGLGPGLGPGRPRSMEMVAPASSAIRLIDFGGATYDDEHKSSVINTRQVGTLRVGWAIAQSHTRQLGGSAAAGGCTVGWVGLHACDAVEIAVCGAQRVQRVQRVRRVQRAQSAGRRAQ
jgi:serine/threonine protein kinase